MDRPNTADACRILTDYITGGCYVKRVSHGGQMEPICPVFTNNIVLNDGRRILYANAVRGRIGDQVVKNGHFRVNYQ